jgi:hypothetical protein
VNYYLGKNIDNINEGDKFHFTNENFNPRRTLPYVETT